MGLHPSDGIVHTRLQVLCQNTLASEMGVLRLFRIVRAENDLRYTPWAQIYTSATGPPVCDIVKRTNFWAWL